MLRVGGRGRRPIALSASRLHVARAWVKAKCITLVSHLSASFALFSETVHILAQNVFSMGFL